MIKGFIKASDRLPGINQLVRWKNDNGDILPGKDTVVRLLFSGYTRMEKFEWLDESPADGDWISVNDGLPEVEKSEYSIDVLTIGEHGVKIGFCDIGRKEWWLTTDSDKMLHNVTHWMPLPAPPNKQSLTAPEGV
jgi:Protein of unknown function (DUF551)